MCPLVCINLLSTVHFLFTIEETEFQLIANICSLRNANGIQIRIQLLDRYFIYQRFCSMKNCQIKLGRTIFKGKSNTVVDTKTES
jgi:hypothetical protein